MTKEDLIKLIEGANEYISETEFLIVGSQSIIGSPLYESFKDSEDLLHSFEADVICLNQGNEGGDLLEGVFGEGSYYHSSKGFYLQNVEEKTSYH